MPKWIVTTRATVNKTYYVEAANEKDAEARTRDMQADHEEYENEETMFIVLEKSDSEAPSDHG